MTLCTSISHIRRKKEKEKVADLTSCFGERCAIPKFKIKDGLLKFIM